MVLRKGCGLRLCKTTKSPSPIKKPSNTIRGEKGVFIRGAFGSYNIETKDVCQLVRCLLIWGGILRDMKIKIILFAVVSILIGVFVLYGIRISIDTESVQINVSNTEITSTSTSYASSEGKTIFVSYNSDMSATLRVPDTQYQDILLQNTISASGARYENIERGLVLWEKAPDITITQDEKVIFKGKTIEAFQKNILTHSTWIWNKTYSGTGPTLDTETTVVPNKAVAFTVTFTEDGTVNGTTDCNNFSGTYSLKEYDEIHFGSFMSTLMYCDGSQEQEFISMFKNSKVYISEEELILENDKTIYFRK